jgi:hypothetical protein
MYLNCSADKRDVTKSIVRGNRYEYSKRENGNWQNQCGNKENTIKTIVSQDCAMFVKPDPNEEPPLQVLYF